jgi:hypothetical protein
LNRDDALGVFIANFQGKCLFNPHYEFLWVQRVSAQVLDNVRSRFDALNRDLELVGDKSAHDCHKA